MCHDESVPEDDTEHLPGAVGGATRVGRTVRRPTGPWTPAVHELLTYLQDNGLRGMPALHGLDDEGREVLEYVEGRGVPIDREVVLDTVLEEAVAWLRDFHDIVDGFRPEGPRTWRGGEAELGPGQIICHNDPGAYNWIIQGGHFVAMIDWDMAGPGRAIDDLAFLAWTGIPLYREIPVEDVARRLDLLVDAYGEWGPMTVLDAVVERMTEAAARIEAGQARGDQGYINLAKVGEPQRTRDRVAAFRERIPAIEAAL
ncbi:aminoglycoside phosphotransferase [Aeromicrobium chenweiae]|uniref:Aminoglycoside phosphotransferase n=1 Tax=Aeromicrobium chenweiae TaxID=2079793 RepID=A0A2S0WS51_9ACTN|nr:aminoglycoside phosphotransferase [Aeromicrobium chenweiae]TGN34041.1 aminoglycoside phosphotransferase [Aeromicrobium chenweiae]